MMVKVLGLLVIAMLVPAIPLQTGGGGTTIEDQKLRDPTMHWPKNWEPGKAAIFSHNELLIHASCHRVWARLTDLPDWPNWIVFIKDIEIPGPDRTVKEGTVARLQIFGTPIELRITEFVPDTRLAWFPRTLTREKPEHYHAWHLIPKSTGCLVITEESGITTEDARLARAGDTFMHRAHDLWLASLKWTSEQ